MNEISGLRQEIDAVHGTVLALESVIAVMGRLQRSATREEMAEEFLLVAMRVRSHPGRSRTTVEAFDREVARLLELLHPVRA